MKSAFAQTVRIDIPKCGRAPLTHGHLILRLRGVVDLSNPEGPNVQSKDKMLDVIPGSHRSARLNISGEGVTWLKSLLSMAVEPASAHPRSRACGTACVVA